MLLCRLPLFDWMPCQLWTGTCGSVCLSGTLWDSVASGDPSLAFPVPPRDQLPDTCTCKPATALACPPPLLFSLAPLLPLGCPAHATPAPSPPPTYTPHTRRLCLSPSPFLLAGLMTMEAVSSPGGADGRAMDAAWHGAEAYHFWLLAHRQLYSGQVRAGGQAMCWVLAAGLLLGGGGAGAAASTPAAAQRAGEGGCRVLRGGGGATARGGKGGSRYWQCAAVIPAGETPPPLPPSPHTHHTHPPHPPAPGGGGAAHGAVPAWLRGCAGAGRYLGAAGADRLLRGLLRTVQQGGKGKG